MYHLISLEHVASWNFLIKKDFFLFLLKGKNWIDNPNTKYDFEFGLAIKYNTLNRISTLLVYHAKLYEKINAICNLIKREIGAH